MLEVRTLNRNRNENSCCKEEERKKFLIEFKNYFEKNNRNTSNHAIKSRLKYFFIQNNKRQKALKILAYKPFPREVPLWDMLKQEKNIEIYYPIQMGKRLEAKLHPKARALSLWQMDYIIVPGLFVNNQGYRLGRGGGFYDRALRFVPRRKTLFVGYNFQTRHKNIPIEAHDIAVGTVINEYRWQNCYG